MQGVTDKERIISTGILQNSKETFKSGVLIIASGAVVLLMILVLFFFFSQKSTASDGRAIYEMDQFGFLMIMLLVAAVLATQMIIGISNAHMAKISEKTEYSPGERRTLLIVKVKGMVEMYGEVEVRRICPKCNTATGLSANYCMKCGAELSEDESEG